MRLPVLTLWLLIAPPALADCPVAEDMARGVLLTYVDGSTKTFQRELGSIMVEADGRDERGEGHHQRWSHGFYVVEGWTYDPELTDAYYSPIFDVSAEDLPAPAPDLRLTLDYVTPGMWASEDHSVYSTGPTQALTVAGCAFTGFGVTLRNRSRSLVDDHTRRTVEGSVYLADLGIRIPIWFDRGFALPGEDDHGPLDLPAVTSITAAP